MGAPAVGSSTRRRWRDVGPDHGLEPFPQRGRGVEQEQVDVPALTHRFEHVEIAGRQAGQPEQGDAGREVEKVGRFPQAQAGADQALGRARLADPGPQQSPQLHLPEGLVVAGRAVGPTLQHFGPVHGIAVEEIGHVPDGREPLRALHRLGFADVLRQRRQPRLVEVPLDHLEQRPHRPLGQPRVRVRVGTRGHGEGAVHHGSWEREVDVGAHTVLPPGRCTEMRRQSLRQPPLDPPGGHRDHLRRHGIVQRLGDQISEHGHQRVGSLGSVDVQHPGRVRRRCSRTTRSASLQLGGPAGYAVPVLAPPSGSATMVDCSNSSSGSSG